MNGLSLVLKWVLGSGFGGLGDMCVELSQQRGRPDDNGIEGASL